MMFIIITINNSFINKLGYLSLGHDRVVDVETAVFPLHGAVDAERITQPVVRGPAEKNYVC